jgi:hypothetical protein
MKAFFTLLVLVSVPVFAADEKKEKDDPNLKLLQTIEEQIQDTKIAGDLPEATSAKRDDAERDAVKALKTALDGKQVTFVFPIKDVARPSSRTAQDSREPEVIKLEPPLNFDCENFSNTYKMRLSKDQIQKINDDSTLIVSGKIFIDYAERYPQADKALFWWQTGRRRFLTLSLRTIKVDLALDKKPAK